MEQTLVFVALMILCGFLAIAIIASKFMPRTSSHLRFGSLFLDSMADAVFITWLIWIIGRALNVSWLSWWYDHAWSVLGTFVVALLLIPVNRSLIRHKIAKQDAQQEALPLG